MQAIRFNRKLQIWSAAMAALALSAIAPCARADTAYSTSAFTGGQIGTNSANSFNANSFVDIYGSGTTKQAFGVFDFNTSNLGIAAGNQVSSVTDIKFDLYNSSFAAAAKTPITVNFYLASDTTTTPLFSSTGLTYKNPSDLGGGLNNPGNPGSFAAGTSLFSLGSDTYVDNGTSGTDIPYYSLSLSPAANTYLLNQINNSGNVRLVITTSSTGTSAASYSGVNNAVTAPLMTVDLNTVAGPANNSVLKLTSAPAGGYTITADGKGLTTAVDFGRVFRGGSPALKTGAVITDTSATDPAAVHVISTLGGHATSVGSNNIAANGTTTASIGLSGVDTNVVGGTDITPTVSFQNFSNANDSSIVVNAKAHVVEGRFLNSTAGTTTPNFGGILVGATQTKPISLTTTNTDTNGDLSTNSIVAVTLKANASATFATNDPYTAKAAGKLTVTAPAADQPVDGTVHTTANVTGAVNVTVSGVYGDGHAVTIGTTNNNYTSNFANFTGATKITGEGLTGETDSARVFAQWTGYQAAALSGNTAAPLDAGGVATISNAPSTDNIFTAPDTTKYNLGLRADARVISTAFNQSGWSQTGLAAGGQGTGTVITAGNFDWVGGVQLTATPGSGTLAFDPANKINGTYTATMSVGAEHDAQYDPATGSGIFGTSAHDLPAVQFPLQHASSTAAGTGAGNYTLDGGGLVAPDTNLTGTFTQTGGTATFGHITGGGQITNGAGTTLTAASIRQSSLTVNGHVAIAQTPTSGDSNATSVVSSLTVAGGGQLDLGNNGLVLNYSGASPMATFASQVHSGNIISSLASSDQALGFGEVADVFGAAGGTFLGQTITGSQKAILARYTRMGDANLDGKVDFSDFVALSTHFGQADPVWAHGNFLGDPTVDFADFVALSTHFGTNSLTSSQRAEIAAFAEAHSSAVPEPASLSLAGLGALGLLARRRRA
jgi:fibronectin-binding autotransporter adhesin